MADENTEGAAGGGNGSAGGGGGGGDKGPVPYERFQTYVEQVRTLTRELEDVKKGAADLPQLRETKTTLERDLAAERAARAEERTLSQHGLVDDEAQAAARFWFERVPEKERPKGGIGEWVKSLKEKPDEAPAGMRPFVGAQGAVRPKPPKENSRITGNGNGDAAGPALDAAAVREITDRARKTGDWKEYDEKVRPHLSKTKVRI